MSQTKIKSVFSVIGVVLLTLLMFLSLLAFFSARWYVTTYGRLGFDSILYTLRSDMGGVQSGLIWNYLLKGLLPALVLTVPVPFLLRLPKKRRWIPIPICIVLALGLLSFAVWDVELDQYLLDQQQDSDLYKQYYVNPDRVSITFPEQKRNLVYILLESMETSYLSPDLGGCAYENLIPELYELAQEHINFSQNDDVGGFHCTSGAAWTIAAMVAQTSGIPLKTPTEDANAYGANGEAFLPGVTSLSDILHDAGYYQALMVGSDASFGGRQQYYSQHGTDQIYDLYTARQDGIVPSDYFVWWGMEDLHLFEYAKQELTKIAAQDQPFAFTMLTADTHHIGGYQCELCQDSASGETYDQSISCSSRQVAAFIQWLQEQPFYENTTIIICGDHLSMDNAYFSRILDGNYQRMVYNCMINTAATPVQEKQRQCAAVDLFPSTLAALGCEIEGDRLGLGTNLFSDLPTLAEEMGYDLFNWELAKASDYYTRHFFK